MLRLLHRAQHGTSVSVQEENNELCRISTDEIPEELRLQDFELEQFKPGRHELDLVVTRNSGVYLLRDVLIEFFDDPPSHSSVDDDGGNLATVVEHGGPDAEPGVIQDTDVEEDRNANVLPPAIENNIPS